MKEMGGYIELDTYRLPMLHEGAIALNCGRNALAYLIRARGIRRLLVPRLICDSVVGVCNREGVTVLTYGIGEDFLPREQLPLGEGEWLYLVNYYGQLDNGRIARFVKRYGRVIVDQAQSYFQMPLPGVDTLYTCRKYFGVPDGAFLYTDAVLDEMLPRDVSFERMGFLLGRYEKSASEFYAEYRVNNRRFADEPIKRMSRLTENLLHGIDYSLAESTRLENYAFLHEALVAVNQLRLVKAPGTFMYPFMVENGALLRKALQRQGFYIPLLWPNVLDGCREMTVEAHMANDILPLPIDQRYNLEDMGRMAEAVKRSAEALRLFDTAEGDVMNAGKQIGD